MPNYKGVSEETGLDVIKPNESYRHVLDSSRTLAQRAVSAVRILDVDTDTALVVVHPDGRVVRASS